MNIKFYIVNLYHILRCAACPVASLRANEDVPNRRF